jgi:hypothetical protein
VYLQNLAYQQQAQHADAGYASEDTEPLDAEMAAMAEPQIIPDDADTEGRSEDDASTMSVSESDLSSDDDVPLFRYAEALR